MDYVALRDEQLIRAEAATGMYGTEMQRYFGTDGEGPGNEERWTFARHLAAYSGDDYPYPDPNRRTRVQIAQSELQEWAQKRAMDAPKIAKQYEQEAQQAMNLLTTFGCTLCDATLTITETAQGPNLRGVPQLSHQLGCPNGE